MAIPRFGSYEIQTMMLSRLKNSKLGTLTRAADLFVKRQFNTNGGNGGIPTEKADCVVIGGGVVGIAVARQMSLEGRDVLVLEAASTIGTGTSSRNSEVIHAGIYYRPHSLKADAEEHGATFAFNTSVVGGHVSENGIHLHISDMKDMHTYVCDPHAPAQIVLIPKTVINSAGLCASSLARRFHGLPSQAIPNVYYARGCYFTLSESGKAPFSHLIYPVPEDGGLGVHVTLDMGGQVRFGPDVEWLTDIDNTSCFLNMFEYTVDANRAQTFYPEIRKYYPGLRDGTLRPDYAGIRSKLSGPGEPAADFIIQGKETHGIFGLVNLFGIESPGLTASMAIAKIVSIIVSQS